MNCEACQTELTTDTCQKCGLKQKKVMCKGCMKKFYTGYLTNGLCPACIESETKAPVKNPYIALMMSIIPGVGHLYLGQPAKSGIYLLMFLLCLFIPVIGWIMIPAAWIIPALDAYNTAKRMNRMETV